jgi:hypothetical protein
VSLHGFLKGRDWLTAVGTNKDTIVVYAKNVKKAKLSFTGELCGGFWRGFPVVVKRLSGIIPA